MNDSPAQLEAYRSDLLRQPLRQTRRPLFRYHTLILMLALAGNGARVASCQNTSEVFDAVSIKHWEMLERVRVGVQVNGGRLDAGAVTLKDLIAEAYGVGGQQISGISSWMETERYNIHATVGSRATSSQVKIMLQNMLADRFRLIIRHEPRTKKAYALVVDKGGPKLKPADEPFAFEMRPPGQTQLLLGESIRDLLLELNSPRAQQFIGRLVVDRTGLTGGYHIALTFDAEPNPDGPGTKFTIDFFSALKHELGLRLDSIEETLDQIVVVSATKLLPN